MSAPVWRNVVLQGGGIRSFWQGGFLSVVAPHWPQQPNLHCVSASAAIACAHAAGRLMDAVEIFKAAASRNPKNLYLSRLFSPRPMFPHAQIYRTALLELFDAAAVRTLAQGPEVQVLLCRTRPSLSPAGAFSVMVSVELSKRFAARRLHARLIRIGGLHREFIDARSCRDGQTMADMIIASSCTPPFTLFARFGDRNALDGGVLESVPTSGLKADSGPTLVLLTRKSSTATHNVAGATFIAPSQPLVCSPWDYTRPELIAGFVELGQRDGERFLAEQGRTAPRSGEADPPRAREAAACQ